MYDKITYSFSFGGGVSSTGTIERSCPMLLGGIRHRLSYSLDDTGLMLHDRMGFAPDVADLIDVLLSIALCDRRAPRNLLRHGGRVQEDLSRSINATIQVRRPDRWNDPEIYQAVTALATMLTRDEWTFRFEMRTRDPRPSESQRSLDLGLTPNDGIVALHSGGLDSLLGMANVLAANESATLIPVSVITNSKSRQVINEVTESLRRSSPRASIQAAHIELFHRKSEIGIDDRASEYRTRILICLAAGIAVATGIGIGRLRLTENGPGAINLPASPEQLDAWTTRATHPKTLAAVAHIATLVIGQEFFIENTGLFKTKGQLAEQLRDIRFIEPACLTVSCDRFPYFNADAPCGTCMSCLYRQIALHRVGMTYIDNGRQDRRGGNTKAHPRKRLMVEKSALGMHVGKLQAHFASPDPYRELDAEYLRIDEVLSVGAHLGLPDDEVKEGIVDLYREFISEVGAYLHASVRTFPLSRKQAAS